MELNVEYVWCPDCMTLHRPHVLEKENHTPGKLALMCPYGKPFNSTLMIIKEVADDTEV